MTTTPIARTPLKIAIAVMALVWFGVAIFLYTKIDKAPAAEAPTTPDVAAPAATVKSDYRGSFIFAAVAAFAAGATCLAAATFLATRKDNAPQAAAIDPDVAGGPVPVRVGRAHPSTVALLIAGVATGAGLLLIGTRFFSEDFNLLNAWISQGQSQGVWKAILSLLGIVLGAGIMVAATLPARAEERNDQNLRRLVYGTNTFVTGLMLLIGLVIVNVFVAVKLPSKLDTTESGFFTLAPSTQEYIRNLDTKITVYAFLGDERWSDDTRWLLTACQDLNPQKFIVNTMGTSLTRKEITELREKFKQIDLGEEGLIVAAGEEGSSDFRYSFVRSSDMVKSGGRGGTPAYVGEGRLMKEVLYLAGNKEKPTIYFTQGSGEMTLDTGGENANPRRTMGTLKTALEASNLTLKPLIFDEKSPRIPDDAAIIVVADPSLGMKAEVAAVLKAWMVEPKPGKPKGKLIIISGPSVLPGKNVVTPTGLEELLTEFNVTLQAKYLMNVPADKFQADLTIATPTQAAVASRNPVAMLMDREQAVLVPLARPMEVMQPGSPMFSVTRLLITLGQDRPTWLEDTRPDSIRAVFEAFKANPALATQRGYSQRPRTVAVAVSENNPAPGGSTVGRLLVYGSAEMFNDDTARQQHEAFMAPQILNASVDWLRDRPFVEAKDKEYGIYRPKPTMEASRVLFMPLGLTVLILAAIGGTVWIVRRK